MKKRNCTLIRHLAIMVVLVTCGIALQGSAMSDFEGLEVDQEFSGDLNCISDAANALDFQEESFESRMRDSSFVNADFFPMPVSYSTNGNANSHSNSNSHSSPDDNFGNLASDLSVPSTLIVMQHQSSKFEQTTDQQPTLSQRPFSMMDESEDDVGMSRSEEEAQATINSVKSEKNRSKKKSKIKPYKCSEKGCDKAFFKPEALTKHIRFHEKLKNITEGELYGQKAEDIAGNTMQRSPKDNKNKRWQCPDSACHKKIPYDKSYVIAHLRKHTGEKPFICVGCAKPYAYKQTLKNHMTKCAKVRNVFSVSRSSSNSNEISDEQDDDARDETTNEPRRSSRQNTGKKHGRDGNEDDIIKPATKKSRT